MNHAQLALLVLDDLYFYVSAYLGILLIYLVLYRKHYWGIFDPIIWTFTNMAGGGFCVFFLYMQDQLAPLYKWSFLTTEIAMFIGLTVSRYIPPLKLNLLSSSYNIDDQSGISEFDVFTWLVGTMYIFSEIASFMIIGIVLFEEGVNHLTAFTNHGVLMAFITSYRTLCPLVLFYKVLIAKKKLNYFDYLCCAFAVFGIVTTGSKSSILIFVFLYLFIQYPLIYSGKVKPIKIPIPVLLGLICFPIIVVSITSGADTMGAIQGVFIRLLSSGDIYLLGYNDTVMNLITEKSFLPYAFYPGFGTILKNLGFDITTPVAIGTDMVNYHYGSTEGGPNCRVNYIALHFFGFWGAILYTGFVGTFVGYVRNSFKNTDPYKMSYFGYLFITLTAYLVIALIDDINIFGNYMFWRLTFLTLSYLASKTLYLIIRNRGLALAAS